MYVRAHTNNDTQILPNESAAQSMRATARPSKRITMANTYRPIINPQRHVVRFKRSDLLAAISALDRSGAQEIGIEIELVR